MKQWVIRVSVGLFCVVMMVMPLAMLAQASDQIWPASSPQVKCKTCHETFQATLEPRPTNLIEVVMLTIIIGVSVGICSMPGVRCWYNRSNQKDEKDNENDPTYIMAAERSKYML